MEAAGTGVVHSMIVSFEMEATTVPAPAKLQNVPDELAGNLLKPAPIIVTVWPAHAETAGAKAGAASST